MCCALNQKIDYSNQTEIDDLVESRWAPISEVLNYDLIPNLIPTIQNLFVFILS